MITNRKMNTVKRIAFAASDINRKAFIEWSYYNQGILKQHELIATGAMADILEGTVGVPVTRLPEGAPTANHELASLVREQKIDILFFFWEGEMPLPTENAVRALHDLAISNNIIIASNLATADFVLSSALMQKQHSVPIDTVSLPTGHRAGYFDRRDRRVLLKVNNIN